MSFNNHLMPHSPTQRNYSGVSLVSSSGSDSHDSDSNVSDLVVDVSSKFVGLKSRNRKSQDGDFVPLSGSSSKSNSESRSDSESDSDSKSDGGLVIADAENGSTYSTDTNSRSISPQRSKGQHSQPKTSSAASFYRTKVGQSPRINRDSPFHFNRSNVRQNNSKYSYELCPRSFDILPPQRRAAANVRYNYSEDSDQSNDSGQLSRKLSRKLVRRDRGRRKSDSEFEMSGESEEEPSNSDSFIDDDDVSEEEYQPSKSRGGNKGRMRRKFVVDDEGSDSDYMPGSRRPRKRVIQSRKKLAFYTHPSHTRARMHTL